MRKVGILFHLQVLKQLLHMLFFCCEEIVRRGAPHISVCELSAVILIPQRCGVALALAPPAPNRAQKR
jgi:hypothetical protein